MVLLPIKARGRASKPGSIQFDPKTGRVLYFVQYTECPDCHDKFKVLCTIEEIRAIANRHSTRRQSWRTRFIHRLAGIMED